MYEINFETNDKYIHFIGIGGISMSGLAELLLSKGFKVSGSDSKESELTKHLEKCGAQVYIGQTAENISDDISVVVITAAIRENNPELAAARALKLPVITRAELLGQVMKQYRMPIAVAGTHGKTTTTSMVSEMLLKAEVNPTLSIGGILPSIGGNFRVGASEYFVTEACEYTNSFLSFFPKISIILNIDADHLDFFKDIDDIRNSFRKFAMLLPEDGVLIINGETDKLDEITKDLKCRVITFGLNNDCDFRATDISYDEYARPTFTVIEKGNCEAKTYTLGVTGQHNVLNALSVIASARILGINEAVLKDALLCFTGTDRRFQKKGQTDKFTVIDDYAHHPTEIAATLSAAKSYPHNHLWIVFQPHTYTRTKSLMDEFATALSTADNVILPDIYAARETDNLGISSADLCEKINNLGGNAVYIPEFCDIEKYFLEKSSNNDLLITMGAGDVYKVGENLLNK